MAVVLPLMSGTCLWVVSLGRGAGSRDIAMNLDRGIGSWYWVGKQNPWID
jgi:hypothetical protein